MASGFICAFLLVTSSVNEWINNPTGIRRMSFNLAKIIILLTIFLEVEISTFSLPVTTLQYPAITICKENGFYDVGEYIRLVFNQFRYVCIQGNESCNDTALLKNHYHNFIGASTKILLEKLPSIMFSSFHTHQMSRDSWTYKYIIGIVFNWAYVSFFRDWHLMKRIPLSLM